MKIRFESSNKYDPENVLQRISDERIIDYFFGHRPKPHTAFKCCFHDDSTASMYFKRLPNGRLFYTCFGCGAKGDAFNMVKDLNKISYKDAIRLVVDTIEGKEQIGYVKNTYKENFERAVPTKIIPYFRRFSESDLKYWASFFITPKTLTKYKVRVCDRVFILTGRSDVELKYSSNNPVFCYMFGNEKYKIYRPLNPIKKGKFFTNINDVEIQGFEQLPKRGESLIITSSLKDVMVLSELGYNAIAPQSENANLSDELVSELTGRFKTIYVLYDSDRAGYEYGEKLNKLYGFKAVFIPEMYGQKDISDFIKTYGLTKTQELIKKILNG